MCIKVRINSKTKWRRENKGDYKGKHRGSKQKEKQTEIETMRNLLQRKNSETTLKKNRILNNLILKE